MTPEDCQTLDDYIAFFDSIPEERWICGNFANAGNCCAYGHLGWRYGDSPEAGRRLMGLCDRGVDRVNDGQYPDYQQPTPKQRVLAYLCDVRDGRAE